MKRFSVLLLLVLLLAGASTMAFNVKLSYFSVERQGNNFVLTWKADLEEDVRAYELYRKTSYTSDFAPVHTITPHGVDKEYRFTDDQVYKSATEELNYRLDAVFTNGLRQQVAERKLNYTPTAVRRTWGSIKAMFQ